MCLRYLILKGKIQRGNEDVKLKVVSSTRIEDGGLLAGVCLDLMTLGIPDYNHSVQHLKDTHWEQGGDRPLEILLPA